ncbi:hypothetical protein HDU97_008886, partial [Phlyctochytrium planicorne]
MYFTKLVALVALTFTASTLAAPLATSNLNRRAVSFNDVDITKIGGDGAAALAAAEELCPESLGAKGLEEKRKVAEDAELKIFNPAIAAAKDKATIAALKCQKNRNKVFKN